MNTQVYIHPHALVESDFIGEGTRIWAFAHVMKGARVGRGCNLCDHVFVEGGAQLGDRVTVKNGVCIWDGVMCEDDVFLGPNASLTNVRNPRVGYKKSLQQFDKTRLSRGATIGANATLICPVVIGAYAFVAAAAVVTHNVPAHALVVGNPARQIGWVCRCCRRLPASLECPACALCFEVGSAGLTELHVPD